MVQITLRALSKSYGKLKVLQDLDLVIEDRAYVCLLGPSGCGKSTLMRIVAGLEDADQGQILFDGKEVSGLGCAERDVGLAFQNYALYPHLDVAGNLRFPLQAPRHRHQYSKAEINSRIDEVSALLEIGQLLHRTIDQLSGGQQQRVALGRALMRRPKVLLLDEPVTHLDARLRYAMRSELKRVHQVMGTTTIHVTHDQQEALAMADQLVLMRDGRIEQQGPPMAVYRDPRSTFVASFLGDPPRSLFRGLLERRVESLSVRLGDARLDLPPTLVSAAAKAGIAGGEVVVAIPARAVTFAADEGALTGVVRAHEMIEGAQRIVLDVAGERLNTHSTELRHVVNGDRLPLSLDLTVAQLFDAQTGARVV